MTVYREGARRLVVLASGGVDSAVLLAHQSCLGDEVQPIYIRFGLAWEAAEEEHLRRFLETLPADGRVRPLIALEFPVADVYGPHWSVSGAGVPDEGSSDAAVYLPGRNLLLLAKSSVWCALNDFGVMMLGTLKANPFADSGSDFLSGLATLASSALGYHLAVETPFAGLNKVEVLERGRHLPLGLTFSCIDPEEGEHCGRCNKCAERRRAFAGSGLADPTVYASH
ncbi:MAG TPA: 7-cyano-7-deazaguanine synthase [Acidimicrobiales bacterium]|nr:7-cyano-7-deazaguanine synthase [Acidimicrobiales bacterium]